MGTFFHGWRRKFGLMTLSLALLLMAGWLRSLSNTDIFTLPIGKLPLGILISTNGSLSCTWADYSEDRTRPDWNVSLGAIPLSDCGYLFDFAENKRQWRGPILFVTILSTSTIAGLSLPDGTTEPQDLDAAEENELVDEIQIADHQVSESTQQQPTSDIVLVTGATSIPNSVAGTSMPASGTVLPIPSSGIVLPASPAPFNILLNSSPSAISLNLGSADGRAFALWAVPYWAIVVPLTLIAAYLLIVKPAEKKRTT